MLTKKDIYINYIKININSLELSKKKNIVLYLYNNFDKSYFIEFKKNNKIYINEEVFKILDETLLISIYDYIKNS